MTGAAPALLVAVDRGAVQKVSLEALGRQLRRAAAGNGSGRAADTVHGGHEKALRQTLVALAAGQALAEHENPGGGDRPGARGPGAAGGGAGLLGGPPG